MTSKKQIGDTIRFKDIRTRRIRTRKIQDIDSKGRYITDSGQMIYPSDCIS